MKSAFKKTFIPIVILALMFSVIGITSAHAATLVVTNTTDSGPGSLRQVIADAALGDTVTFDPGLSGGTIYLQTTLTLSKDVILDGSALASQITISGDSDNNGTSDVRVFVVNPSVTATLNSLVVTKGGKTGNNGGGIYNNGGTLTVTNSTLAGNSTTSNGGGIYNRGTLTVTNSALSGNSASGIGGGIFNNVGTLTVIDSTLTGNSASSTGGGIYNNGGTLTVTNSTLAGNSSANGGGGIYNNVATLTVTNSTLSANTTTSNGGGIYNYTGSTLAVTNSTLAGNSAFQGGGLYNDGTLTVTNSTLAHNTAANEGGGIYNYTGMLNYANTIIVNGSVSNGRDCYNDSGTIGTNTNNLVEGGFCAASLSSVPNLGPLASNGGSTQTFALLTGSSAIDAGNDGVCTAAPVNNLDQRGVARPVGAHCDIGAYEAALPLVATPTVTVTPTVTATVGLTDTATKTATATATNATVFNITPTVTATNAVIKTPTKTATPVKVTLKSIGAQDGWVLESSETSNVGSTLNNTTINFMLGDDANRKQYRGILSFNTAGLPDNAIITAVALRVQKQGIVGGGNPLTTFQGFVVNIKTGLFGTAGLQTTDFQALASMTYGPFTPALVSNWYSINLTPAKAYINKLSTNGGLTQIRLRFALDDNNNAIANYLSLFSGNALAVNRPQLVITYHLP